MIEDISHGESRADLTPSSRFLDEFRAEVCRELEVGELGFADSDHTWVAKLPGAGANSDIKDTEQVGWS